MAKTTIKKTQKETTIPAEGFQEEQFFVPYYIKQMLKESKDRLSKEDFDNLSEVLLLPTKINLQSYVAGFEGAGSMLPRSIDTEPLKLYAAELNRVLSYRERSALKSSMLAALNGIPPKYIYSEAGVVNFGEFNFTRALGFYDYNTNLAIDLLKQQEREMTIDKDVRTFLLGYIGRQTGGIYLNASPRHNVLFSNQGSEQKYQIGVNEMQKVEISMTELYTVARTMTYPLALARIADTLYRFIQNTPALAPVLSIMSFLFSDPSRLVTPQSLNDVKWDHKQNEQLFSVIVLFQYLIQHLEVTDLSGNLFSF